MKNISRRVFIKGMAVAAVATAASTVLTGCKLPSGVTEGETEVVVDTKTVTLEDKTNNLKIAVTATGCEYLADSKVVAIPVKLVNTGDEDIKIQKISTTGTDYSLQAQVYFDSKELAVVDADASTNYANGKNLAHTSNNTIAAQTDLFASVVDGKLYFNASTADADWKSVTVVLTLGKCDGSSPAEYAISRMTFNR